MFVFKKAVVVLGALAALAIPAVASADDYGHRTMRRDDHAAVQRRDRDHRGEHRGWEARRRDWREHGRCR